MLGIGLYGLTYIYPVYLAVVRGYSSLMIGKTMFVTGACMFLTAPIAGRLMTQVDPRLMIAIGFIFFAIGTYAGLVHHRGLGLLGAACGRRSSAASG